MGYFDEKTKTISEYVLETDLITKSNKGIKHYEVILDPKSWMWHFGKELEINDSDEGYVYALNLLKYAFLFNQWNFHGYFGIIILHLRCCVLS